MRTLTKILEKIGENYVWAAWMYGAPLPRPPYPPQVSSIQRPSDR